MTTTEQQSQQGDLAIHQTYVFVHFTSTAQHHSPTSKTMLGADH